MRWKLLVAALLFAASPAFADSTVPALTAGTTLTGTVLYGAQGGTLDRKFGMDTTLFGISTGNITINSASIGNTLLTNPSTTVNGVVCALGGSCTAGLTALTGDGTASGNGSQAFTLATVNASPGATTCSNITTNGKGLVTTNTTGSCSGGGGTGSGVDGGAAQVTITASCTLGTTAACLSHAIRQVSTGTLAGAITITLDSIANVAVGQSPVCIDDGAASGSGWTASHTVTITANASDAINGGTTGGSVGPFTSAGAGICFRPTATHNWTVEASSTAAASTAPSHQFATGIGVNGLAYTQPACADLSTAGTGCSAGSASTSTAGIAKLNEPPISIGWQATVSPNNQVIVAGVNQAETIQAIVGVPTVLLGSAGTIDLYDVASGTATCSSGTKITTTALNANSSAGTTQALLSGTYSLSAGHSICVSVTTGTFTAGTSQATISVYMNPT